MSNDQRIQSLLLSASELPPDQRPAFLDAACGGDQALRAEVDSLLQSHDAAGRFLASPTANVPPSAAQAVPRPASSATTFAGPLIETSGARIGHYKLLQLIGEGGFGSVFMAEQEKPVTRKVALKIIKLGMDTRQVVARFEQERQALAMMDHPNIAKVLDAGATETGRPFFVMELVKGDPIVEYCDKHSLSIQDRLELFAQVCAAVQHAHTKGIIHRDIKPSNILVSTQDGRPYTKVIDFGIAKATAHKLTEKTLFTELRQLIGTPEYMSPEQAEGNLDIDTRTDVYSLGVLLYELLTGTTPFTSKQLRSAAYAEIQRIIREVEPPKPSTRLSSNTDTIASVAAKRHTEPKRLGTIVRGELDWIVMKALEKDRQRRYETANGLAMDIRRYLSGEAVNAAPPSTAYRFKKFIRRNRVLVSAGSAVAAALLIGLVAFAWQAKIARDQRDIAVQAQLAEAEQRKQADAAKAEAQKQEAEAKKQAATAEAVAKFQTDMLATADPQKLLGDKVTVLQAIQAAVKELDSGSLKDQPLVEASVRDTIGTTLHGLGRLSDAEASARQALTLRRQFLPLDHPDIAVTLNDLAAILEDQNNMVEAEALFREALDVRRKAYPAENMVIAVSLNNLAGLLRAQNKLAEAEALYRESLDIRRKVLPPGHEQIGRGLSNLSGVLQTQNKLAEAEPLEYEALDIRRKALPANHPDIAASLINLGQIVQDRNRLAEAEPLFREALQIHRNIYPAGHPLIATSLINLALLLDYQNKGAEAEPLVREALDIQRKALPAGHPNIARTMNNLATLLLDQKKHAEAEPLFRESIEMRRKALPANHPDIAQALNNLAFLLKEQSRFAEAEPLYRESLEIRRKAFPAGHPDIAQSLNNLAALMQKQNKSTEAEALFREALAIWRTSLPLGHPSLIANLNNLARLLFDQKKYAEAEPIYRELLANRETAQPDAWQTFNTRAFLGIALQEQNKLAEAEPLLLAAYQGLLDRAAKIPAENKHRILQTLEHIVQLYESLADQPQAATWRTKLEAAKAQQAKGDANSRK